MADDEHFEELDSIPPEFHEILEPARIFAAHVIARQYTMAWSYMTDTYRLAVAEGWCWRFGRPRDDAVRLSDSLAVTPDSGAVAREYLERLRDAWIAGGWITVEDTKVVVHRKGGDLAGVHMISARDPAVPFTGPTVSLTMCRDVSRWQVGGIRAAVVPGWPPDLDPEPDPA